MENPRTRNDKEWWLCLTKTGVKYNPGEHCRQIPSKCTGNVKNRGGGDSSLSRGKKLKLERETAAVIYHEDNPEKQDHDKESK